MATTRTTPAQTGHRLRELAVDEWRPARCNLNPRQGCTEAPAFLAEYEQRTRPSAGRYRITPICRHACNGCGNGFALRYGVTVGALGERAA